MMSSRLARVEGVVRRGEPIVGGGEIAAGATPAVPSSARIRKYL
jgi:hypothetical protein